MQSTGTLIVSVLVCFFIVESLCYHDRDRRQATMGDDPECRKPPTTNPGQRPPECCKMLNLGDDYLTKGFTACQSMFPGPRSRQGPPPTGTQRPEKGCFWECMYNATGFLTKDGKLDREVIGKLVNNVSASSPEWSSTLTAGVAKCFDSSVFNGTETKTCKSGALEFNTCLMRQLFLNCPKTLWTTSDECSEIKGRAEKCPYMHIPMNHLMKP